MNEEIEYQCPFFECAICGEVFELEDGKLTGDAEVTK